MPDHAVLYLRSSKDRADVSIDAQRRALHELASARGLVVVDEYADAVESGKDTDRPAFQRLLADVRRPGRAWSVVLALDTSRVARRREHALMFETECTRRGARVVYKSLPETDGPTEMVLRSMLQAFDEYHSLISRAKGLAGMAENVRQGWRAGGRAPRGYRLEQHVTGAMRDGAPVTKTRLALDDSTAPQVQAYLLLRAQGVPRGPAVARLGLPWPPSSVQSMDWQALTYAGHTVWNMHLDRADKPGGEKRRPRAQWMVQRGTHPALISDNQAETILRQLELGQQGRRIRQTPRLLTGLLLAPDGAAWHSDGAGCYRLGKGRRISAQRVESTVLEQLHTDLTADTTVQRLVHTMQALADDAAPVDGRRVAGLQRRADALAQQIARTVDLAAQIADPAPVLRRVQDLEAQRAGLLAELAALRMRQGATQAQPSITPEAVRLLLRRLLGEVASSASDSGRVAEARLALAEVLERVELAPEARNPSLTLHYAVQTGVNVASPRPPVQSPAVRWSSQPVPLPRNRRAV